MRLLAENLVSYMILCTCLLKSLVFHIILCTPELKHLKKHMGLCTPELKHLNKHMGLCAFAVYLSLGFVGFYSALLFVRFLYASLRLD